jgi:hypothetical protein
MSDDERCDSLSEFLMTKGIIDGVNLLRCDSLGQIAICEFLIRITCRPTHINHFLFCIARRRLYCMLSLCDILHCKEEVVLYAKFV